MDYVGFKRLDIALFHIFITPSNDFKVIDTARAMKKESIYPSIILKDLESLGYKDIFLSYGDFAIFGLQIYTNIDNYHYVDTYMRTLIYIKVRARVRIIN